MVSEGWKMCLGSLSRCVLLECRAPLQGSGARVASKHFLSPPLAPLLKFLSPISQASSFSRFLKPNPLNDPRRSKDFGQRNFGLKIREHFSNRVRCKRRCGVGVFHVKGCGSESLMCSSKPRKTKPRGGTSWDIAGMFQNK